MFHLNRFFISYHHTATKKSKESAILTIDSLNKEIDKGVVFIFGGLTDAFGAAQEELLIVLKDIDVKASIIKNSTPNYFCRKSDVLPGLVYDYGGAFRQACLRSCQMHNFERVLIPLLDKLLGKQGMAHDMTTSQGMYRVNYYWMKYRNMLETLTVDAMGGEVSSYLQAPPAQKNLIGAIARTRWLSAVRTSDNLLRALGIPATPIFIKKSVIILVD